jgi:hypothetical protein
LLALSVWGCVMFRHAIALAIVLAALLATLGTVYSAVECKAEPPANRTGTWAWRNIDGKRCWYPGKAGMDKANLKWSENAPDSDRVLLESYWPNLKELRQQP